ncbi:MAG: LuxR C-terminal-related transcriptional regulator [Terriglobia bacterium]
MSDNLPRTLHRHIAFSPKSPFPQGDSSDSQGQAGRSARIINSDDNRMLRLGLGQLFKNHPTFQIVGEAGSSIEAEGLVRNLNPDILIINNSMPDAWKVESIRRILKSHPKLEILIFLSEEPEATIHDILAAGVRGLVLKNDPGDVIITAVEALHQHAAYFTAKVCENVLRGYLAGIEYEHGGRSFLRHLTPREREVLELLTEGFANKEIASRLNINFKTALAHRANIMHKLGVKSVIDLLRFAIRTGLIKQ